MEKWSPLYTDLFFMSDIYNTLFTVSGRKKISCRQRLAFKLLLRGSSGIASQLLLYALLNVWYLVFTFIKNLKLFQSWPH